MHVLIYVRVSTDKQAEKDLSLPAQLHACRQYAAQRDWQVLEEFIEPGVSARTAERPELRRLLARCREPDPKVGAVIVHKLDRLARNLADHVGIRGALSKHGLTLVSVTESLDDSVSGQLVEHIMASIAEFYSANLGEEVKKGMRQKIAQGGWPHLPCRGYRSIRDASGRSRVEVDPTLGPVIRQAFELAARGPIRASVLRVSLSRLGLTTKTGQLVGKNALARILRNPFYCGRMKWNGHLHPGTHPQLVSPELFDRVQHILVTRPYKRSPARALLAGFSRCATCGAFMTADLNKRWQYYRCGNNLKAASRCRAKFCRVDRALITVDQILDRIEVTSVIRTNIDIALRRALSEEELERNAQRETIESCLGEIQAKEIRLADALAAGVMTSDVYRLAVLTLQGERGNLTEKARHLVPPPSWNGSATVTSLVALRQMLPTRLQRALIELVFTDLQLDAGGVAGFILRPPFNEQYLSAGKVA